jgi:DNA-binding protein HU-beta
VNKGELVKQVAERAQLDAAAARRAVDAVIEGISERLGAGEDVVLTGFGKFSVVQRAEREGVNPREPGTRIRIPARRSPRFTPGTTLRSTVAAGPDRQTALDPVSLMANQPTVVAPKAGRDTEQAPGVALAVGQSDGPGIVPAEETKPKSGARSRKSAAKSSSGGSAKGSGGSEGKSSGSSAAKSSGASASKSSGKSAGKAAGKSSATSKPTSRRSGSRRAKES